MAQLLFAPRYQVQLVVLIRLEQFPVKSAHQYCSLASNPRLLQESLAQFQQVKLEQDPQRLSQVIAQPNFRPYPTALLAKLKETHRECLARA